MVEELEKGVGKGVGGRSPSIRRLMPSMKQLYDSKQNLKGVEEEEEEEEELPSNPPTWRARFRMERQMTSGFLALGGGSGAEEEVGVKEYRRVLEAVTEVKGGGGGGRGKKKKKTRTGYCFIKQKKDKVGRSTTTKREANES